MVKRILVADDSITIQQAIEITFKHEKNFSLVLVNGGVPALERLHCGAVRLNQGDVETVLEAFQPGRLQSGDFTGNAAGPGREIAPRR